MRKTLAALAVAAACWWSPAEAQVVVSTYDSGTPDYCVSSADSDWSAKAASWTVNSVAQNASLCLRALSHDGSTVNADSGTGHRYIVPSGLANDASHAAFDFELLFYREGIQWTSNGQWSLSLGIVKKAGTASGPGLVGGNAASYSLGRTWNQDTSSGTTWWYIRANPTDPAGYPNSSSQDSWWPANGPGFTTGTFAYEFTFTFFEQSSGASFFQKMCVVSSSAMSC